MLAIFLIAARARKTWARGRFGFQSIKKMMPGRCDGSGYARSTRLQGERPLPHEPRLNADLRALLHTSRVAALGTLDDDGAPFVSMVPYAMDADSGALVIHVSGLAPHTRNMQARSRVSVLVIQPEVAGEPVHALPRVTLECAATALQPDSPEWQLARAAYVNRFPEAEYMTQLGDFMFFSLQARGARQVAGFGAARSVGADDIRQALRPAD
jgi:heme iron utilization protein